jgi:hypothetical protein
MKTFKEFYDVSLIEESPNEYLININSTKEKPIDWENVTISVFDTWHDDLIFTKEGYSDNIWIRTHSNFGIGSISFYKTNGDPKNKDFYIFSNYQPKNLFNPVIGLFVYPNTEDRIKKTKEHIVSLKKCNIPIYIFSNMVLPNDIIELCNGYLYTGPNEMCNVPSHISNKWEYLKKSIKRPVVIGDTDITFYSQHSFINGTGTYLWPAANCLKLGVKHLDNLGFSHIMISEGEFIINEKDTKKPLEILKDLFDNQIVLDFFYTQDSFYLQAYLWFAEINHLSNSFKSINKEDKHNPNNFGTNALVLCEKYYQHKILSFNQTKKIRVRTNLKNKEILEKKYWYNERTNVYYYQEPDFKKDILNVNEALSFPIYFPNIDSCFLSIADQNKIKDVLDKDSFNLEVSHHKNNLWKIVFFNNTNNTVLGLEVELYDSIGNLILNKLIKKSEYYKMIYEIFSLENQNVEKCVYKVFEISSNKLIFESYFIY